jgi:hypothetical protein
MLHPYSKNTPDGGEGRRRGSEPARPGGNAQAGREGGGTARFWLWRGFRLQDRAANQFRDLGNYGISESIEATHEGGKPITVS